MDVISWAVALVLGAAQASLARAVGVGLAVSAAIRAYQYWLVDPRQWGEFPADAFGALAMFAVTAIFAWIGSVVRARRLESAEVAK